MNTFFGKVKVTSYNPNIQSQPQMQFVYHFAAADLISKANQSDEIAKSMSSGLVFADSKPLTILLKIKTKNFNGVRGIDFLRNCFSQKNIIKSTYVLASSMKVIDNINNIEEFLQKKLCIDGMGLPIITLEKKQIEKLAEILKSKSPKHVWIGISSPKQNLLASKLFEIYPANYYCVGAALDFYASESKEAPIWIRKLTLEWLYRFCQEPKRLWKRYLFGNSLFIWQALKFIVLPTIFGKMFSKP